MTRTLIVFVLIFMGIPFFLPSPSRNHQVYRNLFLGHGHMADLTQGLHILSVTVNAFSQQAKKITLQPFIPMAQNLAKMGLGMEEVYVFPAMYIFFHIQNVPQALKWIEMGMEDPNTHGKLPLMGGFIHLVFLRNLERAQYYYKQVILRNKTPVPQWLHNLQARLEKGQDPFHDSSLRRRVCLDLKEAFPLGKNYLEGPGGMCL